MTAITSTDLKVFGKHADEQSRQGLAHYLKYFVVDSRPPKRFRNADPWQLKIVAKLRGMVEHAAGNNPDYKGPKAAFLSLPKGSDKTSLVARLIMWMVAYSKLSDQSFLGVAAASDAEQAAILYRQAQNEAKLNPWLNERLRFLQGEIRSVANPNSKLLILNSDSGGASGQSPDLIYCDELVFWKKRDLFDMLNAAHGSKRKESALIITTNAGIIGTWQDKIRMAAKADPKRWFVDDAPGHRASWISYEDNLAKSGELLPMFARRMFKNEWTRPDEEGEYVSREQVEPCVNLDGPVLRGDRRHDYIFSMDYGMTTDRATAAVMHRDIRDGHTYLDRMWIHQGSKEEHTPITLMNDWIDEALNAYPIAELWIDKYQLEETAQRYEDMGYVVHRCNFQGDDHYKMAEAVKSGIINKTLHLYPGAGLLTLKDGTAQDLVDELASLIVVPVGNRGLYRVDHRPGEHDDRYTSLGVGVLGTAQLSAGKPMDVIIITPGQPPPVDPKAPVIEFAATLPKNAVEATADLMRDLMDESFWASGNSSSGY